MVWLIVSERKGWFVMAYISLTKKALIAPKIKTILKKYKMKGSLSVRRKSTLILTLKEGPLKFAQNEDGYSQMHFYHLERNYQGKELQFMEELRIAMNDGNHDNSDTMTDYFDIGWYSYVHAGRWDKPYKLAA